MPLVLAGTIDQHVQGSVDYFEHVIKPHIDNQQIKYIGPVDMEQKIDLLSRARGLLNPIQWEEPFGMVMIEAMAVGCPVIAFARGAAPEIVAHRRSGFLVQDVNEMVPSISMIDELDRMVVRAHVERHFTAYAMAEKYTQVHEMIIASSVRNATSGCCSSNDVPALIAPLFTTATPLSSTHVKTDESAPLLFQIPRVAKRTVEVG